MDFLIPVYNEIKQLLEPSVALFIGIITILITKNPEKSAIARERLELVYHPLFLSIEPYLYKNVGPGDVGDFLLLFKELEAKHSLFIYPSLRYWVKYFQSCSKPSDEKFYKYEEREWCIICDYITKEYDRLCKLTYMPLRSTAYRVNNRQYKTKFSLYLGMIKLSLPAIAFITVLLLLIFPELVPIGYVLLILWLFNASFNR